MARNSSGTHSLPAGTNPVVSGTTITPTWANGTLADVSAEITDSLSRSGKGGMTAPLRTTDGTVAAPAHAFTSETGTGFFRESAGVVKFAILGVYRWALSATTFTINAALTAIGKITASAGLDVNGTLAVVDDGGTSKKVTVDAPTGLAADYALTLPTALPGSTLPVTMTAAGVLSTAQLVNAQQNFGTPVAATDVAIKSYVDGTTDTPTPGANVSVTNFKAMKVAGQVVLSGQVDFGATAFAAGATFLTLSAGYRPAVPHYATSYFFDNNGNAWCLAQVLIGTDGTCKIQFALTVDGWTGVSGLPADSTGGADSLYLNTVYTAA